MSQIQLFGSSLSPFVRTALLVCSVKGIHYTLEPIDFKSDKCMGLHPFQRVPVLRHDDVTLFETLAIVSYLDEIFPGPALQPKDILKRAQMLQWISAINDYLYSTIGHVIIRQRILYEMIHGKPAETDKIDAVLPRVERYIEHLDHTVANEGMLVADQLTLADLFLGPLISHFIQTHEGEKLMKNTPNLFKWLERMRHTVAGYDQINRRL